MRDGKKNGHGVNTWANGDRSDGKYRDDKEKATAPTLGSMTADMMASGATVRRTANVFGTISQCNHYLIAPCDHQNYAHITPVVWMTKQKHSFYKIVQMKNIERNTE
jgi:hypothetical protein